MKFELKHLSFQYGEKAIFEDISFSTDTGDVLFLLGPNGTGKTTLFKVMLGILKAQKGYLYLDDEEISHWPRKKIAQFIGYVPQHHNPPFPFSVLEVVLMGRTPYLNNFAVPSKKDINIACEAMESLGIIHLKDENYTRLSGGERQMVLIARALTQNPKILIMDEPTSNLDYGNQIKVLSYIRRLASKDLSVVISTHMPDHALRYATKIALMKEGKILASGKPDNVITGESIKKIYAVDAKLVRIFLRSSKSVQVCVPN